MQTKTNDSERENVTEAIDLVRFKNEPDILQQTSALIIENHIKVTLRANLDGHNQIRD